MLRSIKQLEMIRYYKGSLIVINKSINGKGAFKLDIKVYYWFSLFKIRKYNHTITLTKGMTLAKAYQTIKEFINELDRVLKLN